MKFCFGRSLSTRAHIVVITSRKPQSTYLHVLGPSILFSFQSASVERNLAAIPHTSAGLVSRLRFLRSTLVDPLARARLWLQDYCSLLLNLRALCNSPNLVRPSATPLSTRWSLMRLSLTVITTARIAIWPIPENLGGRPGVGLGLVLALANWPSR